MGVDIAPEFAAFYQHVRQGQICFPRCEDCGRHHWYPMKLCPHCRGARIAWVPVDGRARLYSWTSVHHAFEPALAAQLPYVVGLVEFADAPGVRYVSNIVETRPDALEIGMALDPVFPRPDDAVPAMRFRPAEGTTT